VNRTQQVAVLFVAVVVTTVVAALPTPAGLTPAGQHALATTAFAAVLWMTGALPLPATALLVPLLLTVFGVFPDVADALVGFADPVVFLLLAGFMLAAALQKHGLDRRIAYVILARVGSSPRRLVLGVMGATALLSMLISNTATTAMMAPIALGAVNQVTNGAAAEAGDALDQRPDGGADRPSNLELATLLGTAYAASVGGVGTLIGTPPNAIVVSQLEVLVGVQITFVQWLAIGLPVVVVTLPLVWYVLTVVVYPPAVTDVSTARRRARTVLHEAGPLDRLARRTVVVFGVTAGLWLLGGLGFLFEDLLSATLHTTLFGGAGAHLFGTGGHQGLLYFVVVGLAAIPALLLSGAADWDDLVDIDWGTLLLLGGGISLANALSATGATEWLAQVTFGALAGAPLVVVLGAIVALTVLVGELASNTAMAAILAPLLVTAGAAYAGVFGSSTAASTALALTGAIAASFGFALPVATPPNAIVYGTGRVDREHMLRAGVVLDLLMVVVVTGAVLVLSRTLWPLVLG